MKPEDKLYWINRPDNDSRRDWIYNSADWIEDYWASKSHPHRESLLQAIGSLHPFESVFEIGCNCGPNLSLIRERFTYLEDCNLYGIDVNYQAISAAKKRMPNVNFKVAMATHIPIDYMFDLVLADAVLMYLSPDEIKAAILEIDRITKKAVILVEWHDSKSIKGVIKDYHWARNYEKIFKKLGYNVKKIKLTEKEWPSKNWIKNGYIYIAVRQSLISKTNLESELVFKNIIRSSTLLNV